MNEFKTLQEVAKYIAEKYVFNEKNYPILARLNGIEKKVFAVNHSLLHIMKSVPGFIDTWHLINIGNFQLQDEKEHRASHEKVMVKMLVNALKLLEELGMTTDEVGAVKQQYDRASTSYFNLLDYLSNIAAQCESFDHGGKFDEGVAKVNALAILQLVLAGLNQDEDETPCMWVPFPYKEALNSIPRYMKSK